jgi:hypothetical protein
MGEKWGTFLESFDKKSGVILPGARYSLLFMMKGE